MTEIFTAVRDALVDRFEVIRELGGGNMSRVFLAVERELERQVVIKVLAPELGRNVDAERFRQEIMTAALLQHPQIVPVFTAGVIGDLRYYVMPFISGESLDHRLRRDGRIPADETARLLAPIARALAFAHRQGVVHRDVKPANILLADGEPLLCDFGIAKVRRPSDEASSLTEVGLSLGTATYMSPEQVSAEPTVDGRSDVYSLAIVAYEMLAGAPPFTGDPMQQMAAHFLHEPPPLSEKAHDAPVALVRVIESGLSKSRTDRPDAEAFANMLDDARRSGRDSALSTEHGAQSRARARVAVHPEKHTRRLNAPMLGGSLLLVCAAVWWGWVSTREASAAEAPAVAVLPFELIGDDTDAYLAAGMADEVMTGLGQVQGLRVLSRATTQALVTSGASPSELRAQSGVSALVEGTVQRQGDRLRVTARLVNTEDGSAVWSERYERSVDDLFATQLEIGDAVAGALVRELRLQPAASARVEYVANAVAYDHFLRGRYALLSRGEAGLIRAQREFSEAARIDPGFARAHAGIAEAAALLPLYSATRIESVADTIRASATRALVHDSTLAAPYVALGVLARGLARWNESASALRTAVRLDSMSADAHQQLGELLFILGELEASRSQFARAAALEPTVTVMQAEYAFSLVLTDSLDRASAVLARADAGGTSEPFTPFTQAMLAERRGDVRGAIPHLRRATAAASSVPFFEGVLVRGLRLAGDTAEASTREAALIARSAEPSTAFAVAVARLPFARVDEVVPRLIRAAEARDQFALLVPLRMWWYDSIRHDPQFAAVAQRLGLPESAWDPRAVGDAARP